MAAQRRGLGWEIYHTMSKTDWVALLLKGSKYITHDSWGVEVISRKDAEKLLRAERTRPRLVVLRMRRKYQQKARSLVESGGCPEWEDAKIEACDELLERLR